MWLERLFLSCNSKDIGILYFLFALFSGLLGTAYSVLIRLVISGPSSQFISDNRFNISVIPAHDILMILCLALKLVMFFIAYSSKTSDYTRAIFLGFGASYLLSLLRSLHNIIYFHD